MIVRKEDMGYALSHWPYFPQKTKKILGKTTYAPFYFRWRQMRHRCYSKTDGMFYLYGGRGIYMCEEWRKNFWNFFLWCCRNYKEGCSIDRINNDGPYSPDNCRFATPAEQQTNFRMTDAKRNATKKALAVLDRNPHLRTKGSTRCPVTGRFV